MKDKSHPSWADPNPFESLPVELCADTSEQPKEHEEKKGIHNMPNTYCDNRQFGKNKQTTTKERRNSCNKLRKDDIELEEKQLEDKNMNTNNNAPINKQAKKYQHKLKCFYTNADSLVNKMTEFRARVGDIAPDIIVVTEAKPKNARYMPLVAEYAVEGYDMFRLNMDCIGGRGIILYTSTDLEAEPYEVDPSFNEIVCAKMKLGPEEDLLVAAVYRSPNSTAENNDDLNRWLSRTGELKFSHKLIIGDFNYPDINWETWTTVASEMSSNFKFIESLRDSYMYQHIDAPTRGRTGQNPSILDLIITNEEGMVSDIMMEGPLGKSDHSCINFDFVCRREKTCRPRTKYYYDKADYAGMAEDLRKIDWKSEFEAVENDPDRSYSILLENLQRVQDMYVPHKVITGNRKRGKVSLPGKTLRILRKKHRAWQRFLETREGEKYLEYAKLRNKVRSETRKAKKMLEREFTKEAKLNPRTFWHYVSS